MFPDSNNNNNVNFHQTMYRDTRKHLVIQETEGLTALNSLL